MPAPPPESEPAMVTAIGVMQCVRARGRGALARIRHQRRALRQRGIDDGAQSRAAAVGSGASDSAEITETPSAPAAITCAALSRGDAGDGAHRKIADAMAEHVAISRRPSSPIGGRGLFFETVANTPPMPT